MALDLVKRVPKGSPISTVEHDQNLTDIETLVNSLEAVVDVLDPDMSDAQNAISQLQADVDTAEATIVNHESRIGAVETHAGTTAGNPHAVTKADVGLSLVTNVAPGSGNGLDADTIDGSHASEIFDDWYKVLAPADADTVLSLSGFPIGISLSEVGSGHSNYPITFGTLVTYNASSTRCFQEMFLNDAYSSNGYCHRRTSYNDQWSAWFKVWNANNDGAGSGLDADLLDGVEGANYLRSDVDDNVSGNLTFANTASLLMRTVAGSGKTVMDMSSADDLIVGHTDVPFKLKGSEDAPKYNENNMFHAGSTNEFAEMRNCHLTKYKYFEDYDDAIVDQTGIRVFVRDGVMNINPNVNETHDIAMVIDGGEVWHSTNDGHGSGLDADTLDGNHSSSYIRADADSELATNTALDIGSGNGSLRIKHDSATERTWIAPVESGSYNYGKELSFDATTGIWEIEGGLDVPGGDLTVGSSNDFVTLNDSGFVDVCDSAGFARVHFKDLGASEFDCKIQQNSDGLDIWTGGEGSGAKGLTISSSQDVAVPNGDLTVGGDATFAGSLIAFDDTTTPEVDGEVKFGRTADQFIGLTGNVGGNFLHSICQSTNLKPFIIRLATELGLVHNYSFSSSGTAGITIAGDAVWHEGNDGTGSGLDADLLDGMHASEFIQLAADSQKISGTADNAGDTTPNAGNFGLNVECDSAIVAIGQNSGFPTIQGMGAGTSYELHLNPTIGTVKINGEEAWHAGNDGSGSGLDADTVDGLHMPSISSGDAYKSLVVNTGETAFELASVGAGAGNLLINPQFNVNQRAYAGGALSAYGFGYDRWRAGSSGLTTMAVSGGQATIVGGEVYQRVESSNMEEGEDYTISWEGTSQFKDRDNSIFVDSPFTFTFTATAWDASPYIAFDAGTLKNPMLVKGTTAAPFVSRQVGLEWALCQRYYEVLDVSYVTYASSGTYYQRVGFTYNTRKRTTPTVTITQTSGTCTGGTSVVSLVTGGTIAVASTVPSATWYGTVAALAEL